MSGLLLAVPNISEGRDADRIARITSGLSGLIDVHSDPDHNRSVLTIAGEPSDVEASVLALATSCVDNLDLGLHVGAHPRFGVLDVLPFVAYKCGRPDAQEVLDACTAFIAHELRVPIYIYGTDRDLPTLRRSLSSTNGPPPDFGPRVPHPTAGVTCAGVRPALVAFNVEITGDLRTAKAIAATTRERGGGLASVRAIGLHIPHRNSTQVSMNLVDSATTGPRAAFERVNELASQKGCSVTVCELVGLVPETLLDQFEGMPMLKEPRSIEQALRGG